MTNEEMEKEIARLRKALELGVQNVERDIASGNFVGDDDHEFLTVANEALNNEKGQ